MSGRPIGWGTLALAWLTCCSPPEPHAPPEREASPPATIDTHETERSPQLAPAGLPTPPDMGPDFVYEHRSGEAHFLVRDRGTRRELVFMTAAGEVLASALDLRHPDWLEFEYTRLMFTSLLLHPEQRRVLIVGLGGGSMIRFMRRYFPAIASTTIELYPAVVDAAKDYFGIVEGPAVELLDGDGYELLTSTRERYDVIYMDAFIEASELTDASGAPRSMQTPSFMREVATRLRPGGLFVVNFHYQTELEAHVKIMQEAFGSIELFNGGANVIVAASVKPLDVSGETLRARARALDAQAEHGFSFEALARTRTPLAEMFGSALERE